MKNLLIYTGPTKKFPQDTETLARIQIDNSMDLGWKKEDILIATNFPYSYNGVTALQIPDGLYYDFDLAASKIPVLIYLIKHNVVEENEVYWCHDFDAYEMNKIKDEELYLNYQDMGLVPYEYKPEWQFGTVFFKKSALDLFEQIDKETRERPHQSRNNEKTLTKLIKSQALDRTRYRRLNVTYGITKRQLATVYRAADKPIKVLHFMPYDKDYQMKYTAIEMFMHGKNSLKIRIMSDRLSNIFKHHGIR